MRWAAGLGSRAASSHTRRSHGVNFNAHELSTWKSASGPGYLINSTAKSPACDKGSCSDVRLLRNGRWVAGGTGK